VDELVKHDGVLRRIVQVAHIGTEHEGGLPGTGNRLEEVRLSYVHLDGIRRRIDQRSYGAWHVLQAIEECILIEYAVVDRDVKAAAIGGEESVKAEFVRVEYAHG